MIFALLGRCMIQDLLDNNKQWAHNISSKDPDYFPTLARQQSPKYLWIGCSDSRVPANEVVGLMSGELFVHRNVANMVVATDMNMLSVLQYAVDVLQIEHVIVCGHYGCGGIKAALGTQEYGLIDNWLRELKNMHHQYKARFEGLDEDARVDLMAELNVKRQVHNVCHTTIVQNAWHRGQKLAVHGWIYGLKDGLISDLDVTIRGNDQLVESFVYTRDA